MMRKRRWQGEEKNACASYYLFCWHVSCWFYCIPSRLTKQRAKTYNKKGKKKSKKVESHFLPLFHRNFQLFNKLSTKFSTEAGFSTKSGVYRGENSYLEKVWKMLKTQVFNNSQTKNRSQKAKTASENGLSLIFFVYKKSVFRIFYFKAFFRIFN